MLDAPGPSGLQGIAPRMVAVALALITQAALVAVFLNHQTQPAAQHHETFVILPITRLLHRPPPKPVEPKTQKPQTSLPLMFAIPEFKTPPKDQRKMQVMHGLIFHCGLGDLEKFSPKQRAQCAPLLGAINPNDAPDYADHTNRAHNAARWARARARKNAPTLLPCMPPSLASLICLGNGLSNGFDLDAQPGYFDKPRVVNVPNNGDPKPLRNGGHH